MKLQVGDVVTLNTPMLGCQKGTRGVVYEVYQDFDESAKTAASIIFENGEYDGFSAEEQEVFLNEEKVFPYQKRDYKFENVMKLSEDFRNGYWDDVLK
jgi:hypothetical protein